MKTVMQIVIDNYKNDGVSFTDWFIDNYEILLKQEKQQIIDAHLEGWGDAYDYLKDVVVEPRQAEDYYNETYN